MAFICGRCASRMRSGLGGIYSVPTTRSLSSTSARHGQASIPSFHASSNAELDGVLAEMRQKYFIPAYVSPAANKMIFSPKHRKYLEENPQTVEVDGEDVQLYPLDRSTDMPQRNKLFKQALELMAEGSQNDWDNLPALLTGLSHTQHRHSTNILEKMVRRAQRAGKLETILKCVTQVEATGMSLSNDALLEGLVFGLREMAQKGEWAQMSIEQAMKHAQTLVAQLEREQHGATKIPGPRDPRIRTEVLALYLELAAVRAYKHQDGKDSSGSVRAYAQRLLANIDSSYTPASTPVTLGRQTEMLRSIMVWHGLSLALKILGSEMPKAEVAKQVVQVHERCLAELSTALMARNPPKGSYDGQALAAWQSCIR